jgi:uncharacterized DUF497 family protein
MIDPEFEWDDAKAERNFARHGVAFEAIRRFNWDSCVTFDDRRYDYGERRQVSFGLVEERLHAAVWTVWAGAG